MTFGEKIKKVRLSQFYTQAKMAAELGVSTMSVMRWEQGKPGTLAHQKTFFEYCQKNNFHFKDEE
jgi:DNA-binding XRE family transcriptional regulator